MSLFSLTVTIRQVWIVKDSLDPKWQCSRRQTGYCDSINTEVYATAAVPHRKGPGETEHMSVPTVPTLQGLSMNTLSLPSDTCTELHGTRKPKMTSHWRCFMFSWSLLCRQSKQQSPLKVPLKPDANHPSDSPQVRTGLDTLCPTPWGNTSNKCVSRLSQVGDMQEPLHTSSG